MRTSAFNTKGSMVAIVTPMTHDGSLDHTAFAKLLDWHLAMETQAIVVAGTTGESPTLSVTEQLGLIEQAVQWSKGRMPIIAGTGANSTTEAILLHRRAADLGADAGLSVVPYYNKPTQEGLFQHFSAIADSSSLPVLLYDVPGRCVVNIATDTLARLAAHPQIIGIKDATADLQRLGEQRAALPADFLIYSGDDGSACAHTLCGGDGVISVTANIAPQQMQQMTAAALAGDVTRATQVDAPMRAFHRMQGIQGNPIPVKWAMADDGQISSDTMRLPLTPLPEEFHPLVRQAAALARGH